MKKILCSLFLMLALCGINATAQTENTKPTQTTLFAYPNVPDTIKTFENRSNVFVSKFWDNFDFSKPIKNTEAFNSAFKDYVTFFRYAHKNVVRSSISDVMNKAQSNMANFWMFVDDAEKYLYSPEAVLPSDEAYLLFLNGILRSSKVKKAEKERYQKQMFKINSIQIGNVAPSFEYTDVKGHKQTLDSINAETIILFFNDKDCDDCVLAKLRLSTNVGLNSLIKEKKIAFVSIYPGKYSKEWAAEAEKDSDTWVVGAWENADEIYDLRVMPSIYLLDAQKKIIAKQVPVETIINMMNP